MKEVAKELNIQLDNLCQFLPQDMVVEFAKCDPKTLLEQTQKAVGDEDLVMVCCCFYARGHMSVAGDNAPYARVALVVP